MRLPTHRPFQGSPLDGDDDDDDVCVCVSSSGRGMYGFSMRPSCNLLTLRLVTRCKRLCMGGRVDHRIGGLMWKEHEKWTLDGTNFASERVSE